MSQSHHSPQAARALVGLALLSAVAFTACTSSPSLVGQAIDFVCADTVFTQPFVDVDQTIDTPIRCRYIHGGFADGTRFSLYLPEKEAYIGRFYQYITPFPDSETAAQNYPEHISPIVFSISHGAYFVETNEGGGFDLANNGEGREATIGAYRANAACAELSRHIAQQIYGTTARPYGYCFGGSGGAYRTTGGMESTEGVWDGSCPFVLGSPNAIPNVFSVRMYALRVLRDKLGDIVDALLPGGSGDPYATLNAEQRQVLRETSAMGFPMHSWYGWKYMDLHGFRVLYQSVIAMDPTYFADDFWNKPGYLGHDNPASVRRDLVQTKAVIRRIIGQDEAEALGLVAPLNENDRGTADRSWAVIGSSLEEKPAAYELDVEVKSVGLGGELAILTGEAQGKRLTVATNQGKYVAMSDNVPLQDLALVKVGDEVMVDNSNFIAVQTYYRHQVPSPDYYVWNQFRDKNGDPIYPQRAMLLGPLFCEGASGCLPDGNIHGKMILCCSTYDREAFAWQGDWYRNKVRSHLGEQGEADNFRLWYTERALHGDSDADNPLFTVSYMPTLFQALLDVADWVEKGVEPSPTSNYEVIDGQVVLAADGRARGGVQPTATADIDGRARADVKAGTELAIHVSADVPQGTGRIVKAEWCADESGNYSIPVDLSQAAWSDDGEHVEFTTTLRFDQAGTFFPTCRVYAERHGDPNAVLTATHNLAKVRVVVSE